MKVLHINTTADGGAYKAAYRIHKALLKSGIDSCMYVMDSIDNKAKIYRYNPQGIIGKIFYKIEYIWARYFEILLKKIYNTNVYNPISLGRTSVLNRQFIDKMNPDVINLHWINSGFISLDDIKWLSKYKLIWTLHDMWAFTGGCHYAEDCKKWKTSCDNCNLLGCFLGHDMAKFIFDNKKKCYCNLDIKLVGISKWMADCARNAALFNGKKVYNIPNTLDQQLYSPCKREEARLILGLPKEKKLLLFGAINATSDERKGFKYIYDAIKLHLSNSNIIRDIEIVVFGSEKPSNSPDFGLPVHYLGRLHDDISIAMIYKAADVMIVPSKYENFPNTGLESISCGTPVVCFKIGGLPDLIDHKVNGYLAEPYDSEDLAHGIVYVLEDKERWQKMSQAARDKAMNCFCEDIIAEKYINIYNM